MGYRLSANADMQPVDDGMIVLDISGNAYYSLNRTARAMLESLLDGSGVGGVISKLPESSGMISRVRDDLESLASELIRLGLIVRTGNDSVD